MAAHPLSIELPELAGPRLQETLANPQAGLLVLPVDRRSGHQANQAVSHAAKSGVTFATPYVRHANESAAGAARAAFDSAAPYVSAGLERAGEVISKASEHLPG